MFQEFDCCLLLLFKKVGLQSESYSIYIIMEKFKLSNGGTQREKNLFSCMHASESKFEFFGIFSASTTAEKSVLLFWMILEWCKLTLGLSWCFSTFIHGVSQNVYCVCYQAKKWDRNDEEDVKMWKSWRCFSAFSFSSFFIFSLHHFSHNIAEEKGISRNFLFTKISLLFNIWQSPRHTLFFLESHDDEKFLFQFIRTQLFSIGNFLLHLFTQLSLSSTFFCLLFLFFFVVFVHN